MREKAALVPLPTAAISAVAKGEIDKLKAEKVTMVARLRNAQKVMRV
jgi:hypothetical protein